MFPKYARDLLNALVLYFCPPNSPYILHYITTIYHIVQCLMSLLTSHTWPITLDQSLSYTVWLELSLLTCLSWPFTLDLSFLTCHSWPVTLDLSLFNCHNQTVILNLSLLTCQNICISPLKYVEFKLYENILFLSTWIPYIFVDASLCCFWIEPYLWFC